MISAIPARDFRLDLYDINHTRNLQKLTEENILKAARAMILCLNVTFLFPALMYLTVSLLIV
jgi:hypothetical protein